MNMRADRNGSRKTERQSRKTPNQTVDNSKCHTQTSTHMATVRASLFQTNRERTISHAQRPAVDTMSHLLDSKQPKTAVPRSTVRLLLPCRSIDRFQKGVDRGSQLGSSEIAKHKPHNKFASSTLRLEGPALRKCNTKHAKPSKQARTDEVKTLKAQQTAN